MIVLARLLRNENEVREWELEKNEEEKRNAQEKSDALKKQRNRSERKELQDYEKPDRGEKVVRIGSCKTEKDRGSQIETKTELEKKIVE